MIIIDQEPYLFHPKSKDVNFYDKKLNEREVRSEPF